MSTYQMKKFGTFSIKLGFALLLLLFALNAGGCTLSETGHDAKKGTRETGPADIQNFPNGFNNVAHKCDGPNMVYVTNNAGSQDGSSTGGSGGVVAVVPNDQRCPGATSGN